MIGDSTVGKTSLIYYLFNGTFQSKPFPTIGIDFQVSLFRLKKLVFNLLFRPSKYELEMIFTMFNSGIQPARKDIVALLKATIVV